jgi:hypothetical protein
MSSSNQKSALTQRKMLVSASMPARMKKTDPGPFAGSTTVNETWGFGPTTISFKSGFEVSNALMDETATADVRQKMRPRKQHDLEAEALLRKLPKCLETESLDKSYLLIAQAKQSFELAGNSKRVDEMVALHNRLQGDMLVIVSTQQWESKQWDDCAKTLLRAKELYKLYAKSQYRWNLKESTSVNPAVLDEKVKDEERFERVTAISDKVKILALKDGMAALHTIDHHLVTFDWRAALDLHAVASQLFDWFAAHLAQETTAEVAKYTRMQAMQAMQASLQSRPGSSQRPNSSQKQRPISAVAQKAATVSARKMAQLPLQLRAFVNDTGDGAPVELQVEGAGAKLDRSRKERSAWGASEEAGGGERWGVVTVEEAVGMGVSRHLELDFTQALAVLTGRIQEQRSKGVHAMGIQKHIRGLNGRHECELVQLRMLIELLQEYAYSEERGQQRGLTARKSKKKFSRQRLPASAVVSKMLKIVEHVSWMHTGSISHVAAVMAELVDAEVPRLLVHTLRIKKLMNVKKLVRGGMMLLVVMTRLDVPLVRKEEERLYGRRLRRMVMDEAEATIPLLVNTISTQTGEQELLVLAQQVLAFIAGGCRASAREAAMWVQMRSAANHHSGVLQGMGMAGALEMLTLQTCALTPAYYRLGSLAHSRTHALTHARTHSLTDSLTD